MPVSAVELHRQGQVARIVIKPFREMLELAQTGTEIIGTQLAVASALEAVRYDDSVRIVVITGKNDGEFYGTPTPDFYRTEAQLQRIYRSGTSGRGVPWSAKGVERTVENLLLIDKPVIARVNGDATSYGQGIIFGCDIIVAREDAVITDVHMAPNGVADHTGTRRGLPFSVSPGDGVVSFLPHFLPPTLAKEYLFLGHSWTAAELARMNIVNHAVPMARLDAVVDEIVAKLLLRDARALARTKRLYNKALVEQWNLSLDLAYTFEKLDIYEHAGDDFTDDPSLEGAGGRRAQPKHDSSAL